MKRIRDDFLDKLGTIVMLAGKAVLEVGSGDGARSQTIAAECRTLKGVEPDPIKVRVAVSREIPNATFEVGSVESLPFKAGRFDVVMFTLSLHHIHQNRMGKAIREAVRVVRPDGFIVFLEPGFVGSFYEAEILFGACDGDEREAKIHAREAMSHHKLLTPMVEFASETQFMFESVPDFIFAMTPKKEIGSIASFLEVHGNVLAAQRRVNVYKPRKT